MLFLLLVGIVVAEEYISPVNDAPGGQYVLEKQTATRELFRGKTALEVEQEFYGDLLAQTGRRVELGSVPRVKQTGKFYRSPTGLVVGALGEHFAVENARSIEEVESRATLAFRTDATDNRQTPYMRSVFRKNSWN